MAEQRLVFSSGLESLFSKELRAQLSKETIVELRKLGVDLEKPFLPAYPVELWAQVVELVCARVYARDSKEAAHWKLGRSTIDGFGETLIGKAAFAMLRLLGPARSVERAARSYANTNNYTKVGLKRLGPTAYEFHLNELHTIPEYDMGVVEGVLEHVGAKQLQVTLVSKDAEGFTMKIEWQG